MGKGDRRSKRGKIVKGTFGVLRPKKKQVSSGSAAETSKPAKESTAKKTTAKKTTAKKTTAKSTKTTKSTKKEESETKK